MKVSSTSFIHYTQKSETVKSILEHGFNAYFCLEEIYFLGKIRHIGIPMVSFCDIPLAHVATNNYGHYAFGMSRLWGIKQRLLPVCYYPNNSKCLSTKVVMRASEAFLNKSKKVEEYDVLGYSKPMYKIEKALPKKINKNNFIEREWRKVYASHLDYRWKSEDEYKKYRGNKDTPKKEVGKPLRFDVKDIDFILVPDIDVPNIISCINNLKYLGGNTSKQIKGSDKDLLLAKILSYDNLIKNL